MAFSHTINGICYNKHVHCAAFTNGVSNWKNNFGTKQKGKIIKISNRRNTLIIITVVYANED